MSRAHPKHNWWYLIACMTVLSLVLSACAVPGQPAAPAAEDGPITITWLDVCAPITTPITDMLVKEFEAANPNAKVAIECAQGDYAEGIYAKAAAGNLPDVMFSADLFTVPFVENGVLLNLEDLASVDGNFSFDDIYPNILGLGQVIGTPGTFMIPASWDSVQMYYNKDLFTETGAPLPTDEWSWDDLIEACKTIQTAKPDVNCVAIGGASGWDWWAYFIPWVVGYGGQPVSEDFKTSTFSSEESLAGIQA
ncbi:MAG: extracellular solute-binding protein, partial [Caldilineaceae bacterium]|nr:extracellular solute-binding protein [Caldilineaceae bacterium]